MAYARWYDQILKLPPSEKPNEDVIDDDQRLDVWWENFSAEVARRMGSKGNPNYDLRPAAAAAGGKQLPTFGEP